MSQLRSINLKHLPNQLFLPQLPVMVHPHCHLACPMHPASCPVRISIPLDTCPHFSPAPSSRSSSGWICSITGKISSLVWFFWWHSLCRPSPALSSFAHSSSAALPYWVHSKMDNAWSYCLVGHSRIWSPWKCGIQPNPPWAIVSSNDRSANQYGMIFSCVNSGMRELITTAAMCSHGTASRVSRPQVHFPK